jgi:peptidyl-dipeptidase Dcp
MSGTIYPILLGALCCACASSTQPKAEHPVPEQSSNSRAAAVAPAELQATALQEVSRLRAKADQDPLLAPWRGPYDGVPPWDQVETARMGASFETGLALLKAEIAAIAANPEPANFQNTIVPLENSGRHEHRLEAIFGVLSGNLNTPEVQKLEEEWSPKLAAAYDEITFNESLFARVSAVHAARTSAQPALSAEQQRLVEQTYDDFVRQGAKLDAEQKRELGRINQALASAFTEFGNKVLADEDSWVVLEKPDDLAGLPESLRASYKAAAQERKQPDKWLVVNTRSSVDPFLAASSRRDLREKVWKAFKNRGDNGNANDTNATIARIVKLRAERAALLGYASHAHWRMSDTMARDPKKAQELMLRVWPAAVARVREEVADMQKIADREKTKITIEPWDYLYYAEKVRKAKYDLDQAEIKPYFELNSMIQASFWMAEQLYGITFQEITGKLPVFHPEVRVWEVKDKASGAYVGLFYGDYFARSTKRSGAWATGYQNHETFTGFTRRPIVSNNNNFVKGAAGEPVLISLDDAETLFHEFGHALHGLLSEVNYPGLDEVPADFVEFPSQVHEMWVLTRPVLDRFARHYETGQPMPQKLLEKVEGAKKFNQGYHTVEYLSAAIVDMELHMKPDGVIDPDTFERETLARIGAPREVAMRHRMPQFNHLFTGDSYSAGYYSYLWSEVMDADAREAFVETGNVFDPATAQKLRKYILAPGNTTDRAEAFRQFRGRDPDVTALLKKRGFPSGG